MRITTTTAKTMAFNGKKYLKIIQKMFHIIEINILIK